MLKKGDIIPHLTINTMGAEGKCVARFEGQVVFIKGGAPGDVVSVALTKIKPQYLEATVVEVESHSPHRALPFCTHFGLCGGCSWQHIRYDHQLQYKQQQVVDHLTRIGGLELPEVQPILGSPHERYYRNKLDYTFTAQRWLYAGESRDLPAAEQVGLGYHIPRMYDRVFDVEACHLQPAPSDAIRLKARELAIAHGIPFFDLRKQVGFLRTLTIRTTRAGEVMIILQVTYDEWSWIETMMRGLTEAFPEITSANYIINGKRNDSFHDLDIVCWKGTPYLTETMQAPGRPQPLQFRIGPKSFYQTNPAQAERLYQVAYEMASLTGREHVYDLYTGTGTIALYLAAAAARVTGLEYVEAAVADARINAQLNGVENTSFFAGDMKDLLTEAFLMREGRPDVIITDPPRAGMHEEVVKMIRQAAPQRIVYVSCNPATQARDLQGWADAYTIKAVQPVDMFPHTTHVENVVQLEKREPV